MNLYFDHILGKQKNKDFVFSLISATFKEDEWDWAFENGWAPTTVWFDTNFANDNPLIWYQCRQSRIKLSNYKPNPKTKKLINDSLFTYKITDNIVEDLPTVYKIYLNYCKHKNFGDLLSIDVIDTLLLQDQSDKKYYIKFYVENKLVAITKLSLWSKSLLSEIFWWDYNNPELSLGKISFYIETILAKQLNVEYLYTGISYNADSAYKSLKKGFQFWTGRYWSFDVDLFNYLCEQDDSINTLDSLHEYQYQYLRKMKV